MSLANHLKMKGFVPSTTRVEPPPLELAGHYIVSTTFQRLGPQTVAVDEHGTVWKKDGRLLLGSPFRKVEPHFGIHYDPTNKRRLY